MISLSLDYSGYGHSQWGRMLQSNVVSHWLSPYPQLFLWSAQQNNVTRLLNALSLKRKGSHGESLVVTTSGGAIQSKLHDSWYSSMNLHPVRGFFNGYVLINFTHFHQDSFTRAGAVTRLSSASNVTLSNVGIRITWSDTIITTKQSTTKPRIYFMRYTEACFTKYVCRLL